MSKRREKIIEELRGRCLAAEIAGSGDGRGVLSQAADWILKLQDALREAVKQGLELDGVLYDVAPDVRKEHFFLMDLRDPDYGLDDDT